MAVSSRDQSSSFHVILLLLTSVMLTACSGDTEPELPAARTVAVAEVQSVAETRRRFAGRLQAVNRSDLAFEVGGPVARMAVELGDPIAPGQVLAQLDTTPFRLALEARQANLSNARAELTDARQDYERRAALAGSGAVSQASIDQASARLERARSQVAALQAEVVTAEDTLSDARLVAPFAGQVVARMAEPNEVVAAGAPVLRVVGDDSNIEAVVTVTGAVQRELNIDQPVDLEHSISGNSATGQIVEIGAEANRSGMFPVTVQLDTQSGNFKPGESIEAAFSYGNANSAVLIPVTAYTTRADGSTWVYAINRGEQTRVAARQVEISDLTDDGAVVRSGLDAGDLIVIRGADLLEDGQAVVTAGAGTARYNQ